MPDCVRRSNFDVCRTAAMRMTLLRTCAWYFLLLGLLVCFIQALVFTTLAMVYISMAIEHEEH